MISAARPGRTAIFTVGCGPNRLLRAGLIAVLGIVIAVEVRLLLGGYPIGVDLEIPLKAAQRWLDGGQPYLASAFDAPPGYDLPFLYPPFVLPLLALLTGVPRLAVGVAWAAFLVATGAWTCRRLAVPWPWAVLILLWPPFFEAILGGNIQIVLFASFVALLYGRSTAARAWRAEERDPAVGDRPAVIDGLLGVANGAFKLSQAQPWFLLLRRRPSAAIAGGAALGAVVLLTLPLTGPPLWLDWAAQVGRASDPTWKYIGLAFSQYLPLPIALGVTLATLVAAYLLPRRDTAAWLGILIIIGSPSLRIFGMLFLLPGMLRVRRELGIVAALLVCTYSFAGVWLAVLIVGGALALAYRKEAWLEPLGSPPIGLDEGRVGALAPGGGIHTDS